MIPHCTSLPLMTLVIHRYLLKTQATLLQNGDYVVKRRLQIERAFSEAHWLALCGFKPSHSLQFSIQDVDHCLGSSTQFVEEQFMF